MEWFLFVVVGFVLVIEGVRLARIKKYELECDSMIEALRAAHRRDLERAEAQREELVRKMYDQTERIAGSEREIKSLESTLDAQKRAYEKLLESVRKARVILER